MKIEVCLSLGSNVGDRVAALRSARERVAALPGVRLFAASPLYETEPVDVDAEFGKLQFCNAVLVIESESGIQDLAKGLRQIELDLGRRPGKGRNLPRVIDIDVICAGDLRVNTPELTVPHPRWQGRRFVVEPLSEVRPLLVPPGTDRTVSEVLRGLPVRPAVRRMAQEW